MDEGTVMRYGAEDYIDLLQSFCTQGYMKHLVSHDKTRKTGLITLLLLDQQEQPRPQHTVNDCLARMLTDQQPRIIF